jgi:peroxin-3
MNRQRRNRNKSTPIVSAATKALAVYGAYKLASFAWNKFFQSDDDVNIGEDGEPRYHEQYHTHQRHTSKAIMKRRQQQLVKCKRETIATFDTFLNSFKTVIEAMTDFSKQTKLLKQMRSENVSDNSDTDAAQGADMASKQDLWNDIKIRSITRMISTAYGHSILVLLLTVQIHLLGGKIFRDQLEQELKGGAGISLGSSTSTSTSISNEEPEECHVEGSHHKEVLVQTLEYFFQHGLTNLVSDVQKVVECQLSDWKVMNENDQSVGSVTLHEFEGGMESIREKLDTISYTQYICEFDGDDSLQSEEVRFILDETLDILESPVFAGAKNEVLFMTFDILRERGYGPLFRATQDNEAQPLVTIVTKLKRICNSFYTSPDETSEDRWVERPMSSYPSIYLFHFDRMNSVREVGDVSFS